MRARRCELRRAASLGRRTAAREAGAGRRVSSGRTSAARWSERREVAEPKWGHGHGVSRVVRAGGMKVAASATGGACGRGCRPRAHAARAATVRHALRGAGRGVRHGDGSGAAAAAVEQRQWPALWVEGHGAAEAEREEGGGGSHRHAGYGAARHEEEDGDGLVDGDDVGDGVRWGSSSEGSRRRTVRRRSGQRRRRACEPRSNLDRVKECGWLG